MSPADRQRVDLKRQLAGETRAREAAEREARAAIIRAERAEQAERSLTMELDRCHRRIAELEQQAGALMDEARHDG